MEILYSDDVLVFAHAASVIVLHWRGAADVARARIVDELSRKVVADNPKMGLLVVVAAGTGFPKPDARAVFAQTMRWMGNRCIGAAYAMLGRGFWASGARAVLMTLNYLARNPYDVVAFESIAEASAWLNARLPQPVAEMESNVTALAEAKPFAGNIAPQTTRSEA